MDEMKTVRLSVDKLLDRCNKINEHLYTVELTTDRFSQVSDMIRCISEAIRLLEQRIDTLEKKNNQSGEGDL